MLFAFVAQTYWLPLDPIGAILISIYIIYRYAMTELMYPRVTRSPPVYLLSSAYHAAIIEWAKFFVRKERRLPASRTLEPRPSSARSTFGAQCIDCMRW
jgi:hypothetical protein